MMGELVAPDCSMAEMLMPFPELRSNEVHVWRVNLDVNQSTLAAFLLLLSADERIRATRYHFAIDHNRFVAARASLRILLARYVGTDPSEIKFSYGDQGKPSVVSSLTGSKVDFNLAHSEGLALIALARGTRLGIDVEKIRADFADTHVPEHFFSSLEVARLRSLPSDQKTIGFFNCWTRKEAYIKATGLGLSQPLDQFSVSLKVDERPAILEIAGEASGTSCWQLESLEVDAAFKAALAYEGDVRTVLYYDFDGDRRC